MTPPGTSWRSLFAEDPPGTIYPIDATHKAPAPGFNTGVNPTNYQQKFLQAINKSPRDDLKALLHRNGEPEVTAFSDLRNPHYAFSAALADLTANPSKPQYAAFFDKDSIYPASLAKIGPIFAAHQLKFDPLQTAKQAPADVSADPIKLKKWLFDRLQSDWKAKGLPQDRQPVLKKILTVEPAGIGFTDNCLKQMKAITHPESNDFDAAINEMNNAMTFLITNLHASYVGSALLQSDLCDAQTGGFWLWSAWGEEWKCGARPATLYAGQGSSEGQAWSAATFLTLLK